MTYIHTEHFVSFTSACNYYNYYGYNVKDVRSKIDNKEIVIGRPKIKKNQRLFVNHEGRYIIEEK